MSDITIRCQTCNAELDVGDTIQDHGSRGATICIVPCPQCLADAKCEGEEEGYGRGVDDARKEST